MTRVLGNLILVNFHGSSQSDWSAAASALKSEDPILKVRVLYFFEMKCLQKKFQNFFIYMQFSGKMKLLLVMLSSFFIVA